MGGHAVKCSTCDLRSVKATQHGTEKPGAQGELTWKWDSRDSHVIVGERLRVNKMAQVSVQTEPCRGSTTITSTEDSR